jgi:CheY-like chemotaxis protein
MKTILVVDDARDLADSTATLFGLLGYRTRTAYDGGEAVRMAIHERPDFILLDLTMPVMDGFEAAREIRKHYTSPPPIIVAVSALAGPKIEAKLREHGFDHYVTKPADMVQLLAILDASA